MAHVKSKYLQLFEWPLVLSLDIKLVSVRDALYQLDWQACLPVTGLALTNHLSVGLVRLVADDRLLNFLEGTIGRVIPRLSSRFGSGSLGGSGCRVMSVSASCHGDYYNVRRYRLGNIHIRCNHRFFLLRMII